MTTGAQSDHTPGEPADGAQTPWFQVWWKYVGTHALALMLAFGTLAAIWLLARPLALIFLSVVIAAALAPVVNMLSQVIPRTLAVVIIFLMIVAVAVLLAASVPMLTAEADIVGDELPNLIGQGERWLHERGLLGEDVSLQDRLSSSLSTLGTQLITVPLAVFSGVVDALLVLVVALYLLIEAPTIHDFVLSLVEPQQRDKFASVADEMLVEAGGYMRGVLFQVVLVGALSYVGFRVIGLDYPLVLAVVMGITEIFPIIGPNVGGAIAIALALFQSPTKALLTFALAVIIQQVEGNPITPYVMHSQVSISPLTVVIAVLLGGAVGGIIGALIGIPLTAALRVFVIRVIAPAVRRKTGAA